MVVFIEECDHGILEKVAPIYYPGEEDMFSQLLLTPVAVKRRRTEFKCRFCSTFIVNKKRIRANVVEESVVNKPAIAPSLFDLCIDKLVKKNANNEVVVESFLQICDHSEKKHLFVKKLIKSNQMSYGILRLLMKDSPTEIRLSSCTWADEKLFFQIIQQSNFENLVVLQLDTCKWFSMDIMVFKSLPEAPNSLPSLKILSLRNALLLFDKALKRLATLAPSIHSVNIGGCVNVTSLGIDYLVEVLKSLRELYIDRCYRIYAIELIDAVVKIQLLEVLSVKSVPTIFDDFVTELVTTSGNNLTELDFAECRDITNASVAAIGRHCPRLSSLDISGCSITDLSLCHIANGCRPLTTFRIGACPLSDEGVSAFLELSGRSLSELSLTSILDVSYNTAMALGSFAKSLKRLNLSHCIRLTNEELLFIVNGIPLLELLILFGHDKVISKH